MVNATESTTRSRGIDPHFKTLFGKLQARYSKGMAYKGGDPSKKRKLNNVVSSPVFRICSQGGGGGELEFQGGGIQKKISFNQRKK